MSSKQKNRGKQRPNDLSFQIQRQLDKGNYKQAAKDAKICYRQEPSAANRCLLERASLLRAQQLFRGGLANEARDVVQGLLQLGVTDAGLKPQLDELMIGVGLADRAFAARPDAPAAADDRLLACAADRAVLDPQKAPRSLPQILEGAILVRGSLEKLEAGDDETALATLRPITRNSPFADWRFFVRGLAAYYRQDAAEMRANWDRLDGARLAARIAAPLAALGDPRRGETPDDRTRRAINRLEAAVADNTVLANLRKLNAAVQEGQWQAALDAVRRFYEPLRRSDPRICRRISLALYLPLINEAAADMEYNDACHQIRPFLKLLEPLSFDPGWHRFWALAHTEAGNPTEVIAGCWLKYLQTIPAITELSAANRELASGMVWRRIAELYASEAADAADGDFDEYRYRDEGDARKQLRKRTVECFEECLKRCPAWPQAYESLAEIYDDWGQPDKAIEVIARLAKGMPDYVPALTRLAQHYYIKDRPDQALVYVERARRLKPLDQALARLQWSTHVSRARCLALSGDWTQARAALETAEELHPECRNDPSYLAKKSLFELKAGRHEAAEVLGKEARSRSVEPAPVWLCLAIEAIRYELPRDHRTYYEGEWKTALQQKCRSETAGAMAEQQLAYMLRLDYPGVFEHAGMLLAYLQRTTRLRYALVDLRNVCAFLTCLHGQAGKHREKAGKDSRLVRDADTLLKKLVRRGRKLFPASPVFLIFEAEAEIGKGPYGCNKRLALRSLTQARAAAEASSKADDKALLPAIKQMLTFVEELADRPTPRLPYFRPRDTAKMDLRPEDITPELVENVMERLARMSEDGHVDPNQVIEVLRRELSKDLAFQLGDLEDDE